MYKVPTRRGEFIKSVDEEIQVVKRRREYHGYREKWPDKSTTSYDMLDFKSYIENL